MYSDDEMFDGNSFAPDTHSPDILPKLCRRLQKIYVELRFLTWKNTGIVPEEITARMKTARDEMEQVRTALQQINNTVETDFILQGIALMEDVLASGDREAIHTAADLLHNTPEAGMESPRFRPIKKFFWEVREARLRFGAQYFAEDAMRKVEQAQRRTRKIVWMQSILAIVVILGLVIWMVYGISKKRIDQDAVIAYGETFAGYIFAGDFAAAEDCMEKQHIDGNGAGLELLFDLAEEKWELDFQSGMVVQGVAAYDDTRSDSFYYGLPLAAFTMNVTTGECPVSLRLCVVQRESGFAIVRLTIFCGVEYIDYSGDETSEELRNEAFVSHETNNGLFA